MCSTIGAGPFASSRCAPTYSARSAGWACPSGTSDSKDEAIRVGYLAFSPAWKPYVETAIETFGKSRCIMASNYSADARLCGFVPLWNTH
jgi:hypothetical protein